MKVYQTKIKKKDEIIDKILKVKNVIKNQKYMKNRLSYKGYNELINMHE